jgi:hypothetical protein
LEKTGLTAKWKERTVRVRRMLVLFALSLIALSTSAAALAAQTYKDTINGYEYYFTSTDGRFAGTASGALPGSWNADVRHTALCLSCTPTATITGGSFLLATSSTLVTGAFTGGTIQVTNVGSNCSNQTFDVEGILGDLGPWYGGSGTGSFSATLTHHRHRVFGTCVTYAASVAGTISLTF